jgi:HEAT repeat protein
MASQPHDGVWVTVVNGLLSSPDAYVRARAAELTAPTDPETAKRVLDPLLSDPNEPVRNLAGRISIERVAADFGALRRFLRSTDRATKVVAAGRILELSR